MAADGWGGVPGVLLGCLCRLCGGRRPPVAWVAAAALALAVAFWMRSAGRGGSEDDVGDVDEDEDEEEVVVLGEAGCALMQAVAGLWAAASAATPARGDGGRVLGLQVGGGWLGGTGRDRRPGGPIWSPAVGEGGAGLRSSPCGFGWAGVLQCVRSCGLASAGGNSLRGLHSGAQRMGLGFRGGVLGACVGNWAGRACRGAWGSMRWVCAGRRAWGVLRGVRQVGPWQACAVVWADGGGPYRGARGCARGWACVGRVGGGGGGAGAGISRGGLLCRCMCWLPAVRLCGQL